MDLIDIGINRGIQQGIAQGVQQGILEGLSQGVTKGIAQGEIKNLIAQISKKKMKNYSTAEAADMLETEISLVQKVYDALEHYDAKTQWRDIMELIQ